MMQGGRIQMMLRCTGHQPTSSSADFSVSRAPTAACLSCCGQLYRRVDEHRVSSTDIGPSSTALAIRLARCAPPCKAPLAPLPRPLAHLLRRVSDLAEQASQQLLVLLQHEMGEDVTGEV